MKKPEEYSYFRAEGESLVAVEAVMEAQEQLAALKDRLCTKFGADEVLTRKDADTGWLYISSFHFRPDRPVPEGWDIKKRQMAGDGSCVSVLAMPHPGSTDNFNVLNVAGLMDRASRQERLEDVFDCGEMPMHALPAGRYTRAFVRRTCLQDADFAWETGVVADHVTGMTYSNSDCSSSDPLDAVKLDGNWYLRVPNKPGTGGPQFHPPDAVPVEYDRMIDIDRRENMRRFKSFDPPGWPGGPIC